MEGTALGIRAIALSQSYAYEEGKKPGWRCAEAHGPAVVRRLVEVGWPEPQEVLMNVNFPDCEPDSVTGIEVTEQGKRDLQEAMVDRRTDLRRNAYYWIGFKRVRSNPHRGTDLRAIYEKRISITPLHLNLTEFKVLQRLKASLDMKLPAPSPATRDESALESQDAPKTDAARQQGGPSER
jgi:5'-nucleotidase